MCFPTQGSREQNQASSLKRHVVENEGPRNNNNTSNNNNNVAATVEDTAPGPRERKRQRQESTSFLCVLKGEQHQQDNHNNNHNHNNFALNCMSPILLSLDLHPSKWQNNKVSYDVGMVVDINIKTDTCYTPEANCEISSWSCLHHFARQIEAAGLTSSEELLHFLLHREDEIDDVKQAFGIYKAQSSITRVVGDDDLELWGTTYSNKRQLAFFFRLMRPLCLIFRPSPTNITNEQQQQQINGQQPTSVIKAASFSFLDVLLQIPCLRTTVIDAILIQMCRLTGKNEIKIKLARYLERISHDFDSTTVHSFQESVDYLAQYQLLDLMSTLPHCSCKQCQVSVPHMRDITERKNMLWEKHFNIQGTCHNSRTILCPRSFGSKKEEHFLTTVKRQRQKLINHHTRKFLNPNELRRSNRKLSGDPTDVMEKDSDGTYIVKAKDMTLEEFIGHTKLMNMVNQTLPRPYYPGVSRPKLQQLDKSVTPEQVQALWDIFFDEDGSLSDSIRSDIDLSAKHGYINFNNVNSGKERQDKRWQVPIRKHSIASLISTRTAVENVLCNIIDPNEEVIYDLGILMGGTADQSLHHDCPRQVVSWDSQKAGQHHVPGWEVDRLAYNDAMSSKNAPSSVLIGMNGANELLVGVQRDQVLDVPSDDDRKYCRAIGGVKGQKFEIVRENEYLVVAKAKTGVMFTGDFPHAGVRNIIHGTEEDRLMEVLYDRIDRVLQECHAEDNLAKTKAVIDILCNFPGLNKLCRFHCSTEFISGRLSIPQNTIGFSECLPNSPDERCLQDESPSKDFDEKKKKKKEEAGPDKKTIKLRDALESEKEDWDDEADDSSDYDPDEEIDDGGFWTWSSPKRSPSTF